MSFSTATGISKPMTAGQSLNVKSSMGTMLGFSASVAGSISIYDDPGTGTSTPLVVGTVINAGWNPLPITYAQGLYVVLTTAAGSVVYQ